MIFVIWKVANKIGYFRRTLIHNGQANAFSKIMIDMPLLKIQNPYCIFCLTAHCTYSWSFNQKMKNKKFRFIFPTRYQVKFTYIVQNSCHLSPGFKSDTIHFTESSKAKLGMYIFLWAENIGIYVCYLFYSKVWPIIPLRIRMRLQIFGSEFTYHVSPPGDAT